MNQEYQFNLILDTAAKVVIYVTHSPLINYSKEKRLTTVLKELLLEIIHTGGFI